MTAQVLIVEDNPLNLRLLKDLLEYQGYTVVTATNVVEAIERFDTITPDIALVDVRIPGGGGERLLREIRSRPATLHLPVLAVTAQAMAGDRERLLKAGFDGYFSKPIDTRTLGEAIAAFLRKRD